MEIIVVDDLNQAGEAGKEVFAKELNNGAKVFGLATGSTPVTTYQAIGNSDMDFSNSVSINLDEYVGLKPTDPQSYHYFMQKNLFDKKPFKQSYVPDGSNMDAAKATSDYEKIIDANPIDLQILGIGRNGHIGFNEPGTPFDSLTHEIDLTQSTIEANARFFNDINDVPRKAYSMGIGTIMNAKHILLEAFGPEKAEIIKLAIEGPVTEDVPASILQNHPNVTVILDKASAAQLNLK